MTCPSCGVPFWRNAKPCAGALVTRDGRLLLVRRATEPFLGHWDIPGGFCEATEHPADTACREAEEETGLAVVATGFLGMWFDTYPNPGDPADPWVTLNAYYHCLPEGAGEPAADPGEVSELAWFAPDALPGEIAFPGHARPVLDAWRADVAAGRTVTPMPDRR